MPLNPSQYVITVDEHLDLLMVNNAFSSISTVLVLEIDKDGNKHWFLKEKVYSP